jgi:hypothetical protein
MPFSGTGVAVVGWVSYSSAAAIRSGLCPSILAISLSRDLSPEITSSDSSDGGREMGRGSRGVR